MTTQQMTFVLPPYGTASLTLPEHLTPDAFIRLELAIHRELGDPQRERETVVRPPARRLLA